MLCINCESLQKEFFLLIFPNTGRRLIGLNDSERLGCLSCLRIVVMIVDVEKAYNGVEDKTDD